MVHAEKCIPDDFLFINSETRAAGFRSHSTSNFVPIRKFNKLHQGTALVSVVHAKKKKKTYFGRTMISL